jgi:hypothetical protein
MSFGFVLRVIIWWRVPLPQGTKKLPFKAVVQCAGTAQEFAAESGK